MLWSKKEKFDRTSGEPVVEESKDDEEWDVLDTNNSVLKENSSILFDIEEDKDEEGRPVGRSSTIYSRDKSFTVTLEDFKLLKRIGEGAFGKVYLVTHEGTDKVYAMKSIRKDKRI